MEFATNGVITRVYDVGASDKMLNIITADHGRIGVMVKGGRSPSSKMRSSPAVVISPDRPTEAVALKA